MYMYLLFVFFLNVCDVVFLFVCAQRILTRDYTITKNTYIIHSYTSTFVRKRRKKEKKIHLLGNLYKQKLKQPIEKQKSVVSHEFSLLTFSEKQKSVVSHYAHKKKQHTHTYTNHFYFVINHDILLLFFKI